MKGVVIKTTSAAELQKHGELIKEVVNKIMISGEHYGIIPGTSKNTLFLTGAQKLLCVFGLGSEPEIISTIETEYSISYIVKVRIFNISDGRTVGYGIGEASSLEEKYSWKKAVSDDEYNSYPEDKRRIKYHATYSVKQIPINYKDIANTVLKMATKRGLVGAVLTVTAAGDVFTQDLEDMDSQTRDSITNAKLTKKSFVSLKDIKDAVKLLGNATYTQKENEKTLLIVSGNSFAIKDILREMGFLYRKEQGKQYGENYMDVTRFIEASNPLGTPVVASCKTFKELDDKVSTFGLALDIVNIDGKDYAEAIGSNIFDNKDNLKNLGFKWSNDDSKAWRFDMSLLSQDNNSNDSLSIEVITEKAKIFGFDLSKPEEGKNNKKWVKAIAIDNVPDFNSLEKVLGFKYFPLKDIYALEVAS